MRKLLLIILIFYSGIGLNAQAQNLDSLWNVWNDKTQHDTTRLKAMNKIAWYGYLYSQPDSAFYYAQMQYDLAEKSGVKKHMSFALNTQGVSFNVRGDYPKALDHLQRSLKIKEEINDKKGIPSARNNIAVVYQIQCDYPKALNHYQRSIKIAEEINDKKGIGIALNNIGIIYWYQADYPKALEYYQRSLKIAEEMDDKIGIANSFNNIGIIYSEQGDNSKALEYYQRSLKIAEENDYKKEIGNALANIGFLYKDQGDYPKALYYYQRSLNTYEEMGDKNGIVRSLNNMGNVYQKQGDHHQAINQCSKGLLLAQEIEALDIQRDACICLYDAHKAMGNNSKALAYHEQMLVLDDSLNAKETSKKLQQMEFQKEMLADSIAKAEEARLVEEAHQEEVRQKNQTRNWSLAGGILALLLAGGFYSRWRFVRKAKQAVEKEKDRSENLLLNILPADIAAELKEKGKADARDFDMVSILFTDFKGFTEQSAKMSASDLVNEINTCFEAFDGIMAKYGVEKIKTIGDAYMAAGGLPIPTDDSVKNTVLAALEMQEFIVQRHQTNVQRGEPAFEMRVGVHTGPVVAGIVGVKKFQYDIWGDTVNTASRMESSGEVGKVNISQSTYELLKQDPEFSFESRGKIEAKGKGEIEMHFVTLKA